MNWKAIKHIYRCVLIYNCKFEYLKNDEYIFIEYYPSGSKKWEIEYKNGTLHGKKVKWAENGQRVIYHEYRNGIPR